MGVSSLLPADNESGLAMTAYDQVQEEMEAPPSLKARRRSVVDPTKVDRLPPFSEEAEQGILGCIIMTTGECLNEAMNGVKAPDAFFDLRHRVLWQTMIWMSDAEIPIDIITLNQCLKDRHQLEGAGGLAYLASLPDTVPSAANLSYYIEILNEKYDRRKLIQVCTETVAKIYEDEGSPIDPLVDRISSAANLIRSQIEKPMTMKEAARQVVELIEEAGKGKVPGLKTGLYKLDDVIGGLRDGELITVAARPGCGKSSLATTLVENIAIRNQRVHTVIFSLEMSRMEICTRLMSSLSNINLQSKIRGYQTLEGEHNDITAAQIQLGKAPIHIVATPRISISQLKAQAKMLVETEGTKFIIVDYLQIVQATNPRDMR